MRAAKNPLRHRGKWTPEKRLLAQQMAHAGARNSEIMKAVEMSRSAVGTETRGLDRPKKMRADKEHRKNASHPYNPVDYTNAPAAVFADLERRKAAADNRDFTATFCGDPPPGYSALDRKRMGA